MVAMKGTGKISTAPHKSTMQRCLVRMKLIISDLTLLLLILKIMLQLHIIVTRKMRMITQHWRGLEMIITFWAVEFSLSPGAGTWALTTRKLLQDTPLDLDYIS